jgi:hypothetical protein
MTVSDRSPTSKAPRVVTTPRAHMRRTSLATASVRHSIQNAQRCAHCERACTRGRMALPRVQSSAPSTTYVRPDMAVRKRIHRPLPASRHGKEGIRASGLSVHREAMLCCVHAVEGERHVESEAGRGRIRGRRKDGEKLDSRRCRRSVSHTSWALSPGAECGPHPEETRPGDPAQYAGAQTPTSAGGPPAADLTLHVDDRRRDRNTRALSSAKGCARVSRGNC